MWNGTTWTVQTTPNPTHATQSYLLSVSCRAARACTAVGYYSNSRSPDTSLTLAETWNGNAWSVRATPNPAGASEGSSLQGVSCLTRQTCTAVGVYTDGSGHNRTLAEVWNGTTWKIQKTPNPSGATSSSLTALSCVSSRACTAVGHYLGRPASGTLTEVWNGTTWAIQKTPNPTGARESILEQVSCSTPSDCSAIGIYSKNLGTFSTLAEAWNGTVWAIQPTPNPSGAVDTFLTGLSCTSRHACTAVGNYSVVNGAMISGPTLAERYS